MDAKEVNKAIYHVICCYWDDDMKAMEGDKVKANKCEYLFNKYILENISGGADVVSELNSRQKQLEKSLKVETIPEWLKQQC